MEMVEKERDDFWGENDWVSQRFNEGHNEEITPNLNGSPGKKNPEEALTLILGFAIFLFEYARRIDSDHSPNEASSRSLFFDDPSSLKKIPYPSIYDPVEKYMSLIIPAYNEEHRLPGALDETMNYLQKRAARDKSFSYEVLIIDDGSTDRTTKIAFDYVRKYKVDNVRVIPLGKNHGKGEAIRKGMLHSRGELLLMLDADGATKITDLEKLESERKWYRNFLMKGFHLVVLLAAGPGIRDTQCGFKMFTRAAARKLFTNVRLKRIQSAYDEHHTYAFRACSHSPGIWSEYMENIHLTQISNIGSNRRLVESIEQMVLN
ncbi:hypothetical protein QJS10_CPA07g00202 [Acorus calamus]|uniref:dolichyl-phosphate beta-glucosyltransferase n=1 Tax=Acorus calamus TaxID=4465 RepID=A0AAV9EGL8_ACOCL|nr:hypothetical protein QJS10_CPA07g00202 [Acorus calamus]